MNPNSVLPARKFWWLPVLQVVMVCVLAVLAVIRNDMLDLAPRAIIAVDFLALILSTFFASSILKNGKLGRDSIIFIMLILVCSIYLFSDRIFYFFNGIPAYRWVNITINTIYLISPVLMLLLFWHYLDVWTKKTAYSRVAGILVNVMVCAQLALIIVNIFAEYYFYIPTDTGVYHRGVLFSLTIILPASTMVLFVIRIFISKISARDRAEFIVYMVIPLIAVILQALVIRLPILSIAAFTSVAFLYTNFYVQKEKEVMEFREQLTQSQLRCLQMQINPHFLYNSLATLAGLCELEPAQAKDMTYKIADYLRNNFTDIEGSQLITIEEEISQIKHFMAIENIRFPDIEVKYDIEATDAYLPAMTLQPIVENAINHGIRKKSNSEGTIMISTRKEQDEWVIRVTDDGVGFQENGDKSVDETDKRKHYGIANVKTRLDILCGGKLELHGKPGEGTEVVIRIPEG